MENAPAVGNPRAWPGETASGNPGWDEPPSAAGQFTRNLKEFLESDSLKIQTNICSHVFGSTLLRA